MVLPIIVKSDADCKRFFKHSIAIYDVKNRLGERI